MNELKNKQNVCSILKNKKCDNADISFSADNIDFSIRNHAKEAFSYLIVGSIKRSFLTVAKNFLYLLLGLFSSLLITAIISLFIVKFSSINLSLIKDFTQKYIATKIGRNDITMGRTKIFFNSESGNIVLSISDLMVGKVKLPDLMIIPNYVQSALQGKLVISNIKFNRAKFTLDSSDDLKNIALGSGNTDSNKGSIFLPYKIVPSLCSFIGENIEYSVANSKVMLKLGANNFVLNNFKCDLDKKSFIPKNISFSTQLSAASKPCNFNIKITPLKSSINFDANVNDLNLSDVSKILGKNRNLDVVAITKFLESYKLPVSGDIHLSFKDNKINFGSCNLKIGSGSIKNSFSSNLMFPRSWTKIKSGQILATSQNETLSIQKLNLKINNSDINVSGINIPLNGENDGIVDLNGTIELKGISKNNLNILPENMVNACLALFEKNIPGFVLNSLKMDISGRLNLNNRFVDDDIKISHGVFSIENGSLPLGNNKFIKNVTAIGEIFNNKTKLEIFKANINGFNILGGNVEVNTLGGLNGILKVEIPLSEIANFDRLGKLIPFSLIDAKNPLLEVNASLLQNGAPKFTQGRAVIKSTDNVQKLNIYWGDNHISALGNLKIKSGGVLALDIDINDKLNSGHKKITFNGNGEVIGFYSPFLKNICSGSISFSSNEVWKLATGTYNFKINTKNGTLNLPIIGTIGGGNSSLTGNATKVGNILNFSDIALISGKNKITGKLVYDQNSEEVLAFRLSGLEQENNSLKLDFYKKDKNMLLTLFAQKVDLSSLNYFIDKLKRGVDILASIKLENIKINESSNLKKLQGTLKIRDGKIVNALCVSVLSDNSKVIFKTDEEENNIITKVTASNAGTTLHDFGLMNTLTGGKLNATLVKDKSSSNICAVNCEITDIIANGSDQLSKLISLTIPNSVQNLGDNIGFNGIVFSLTLNDNSVIVSDGRAIGPTICVSFDGSYDRVDDMLAISGISVPVLINNTANKSIYAPYKLSGSLGNPTIAVNPLASSDHDVLSEIFGVNLQNNINESELPVNNKYKDIKTNVIENISKDSIGSEKVINIRKQEGGINEKSIEKTNMTLEHGVKVERFAN